MILGNKCDMEDKRRISTEQGKQLAEEYGVKFMETSAMNRTNVEQAFTEIATDIKRKMDAKVCRHASLRVPQSPVSRTRCDRGSKACDLPTFGYAWLPLVMYDWLAHTVSCRMCQPRGPRQVAVAAEPSSQPKQATRKGGRGGPTANSLPRWTCPLHPQIHLHPIQHGTGTTRLQLCHCNTTYAYQAPHTGMSQVNGPSAICDFK